MNDNFLNDCCLFAYSICYTLLSLLQNMKNFRSSKNLKILDTNSKDESQLRQKIRILQQQVEMLQKSNLNIFIPLSQHQTKNNPNFQAIINKLKTQILTLQQEAQRYKTTIKKLEGEKEMQRITFQNQLDRLREDKEELQQEIDQLKEQNDHLSLQLQNEEQRRKQKQKQAIQLKVQNKFLKQDLQGEKKRRQAVEKKYEDIMSSVLAVSFNSRIYKSKEVKITAIETQQLSNLKAYIEQLQKKIKELMTSKQQKIYHGIRKDNLGEEIVRLKQNIDLQLGLGLDSSATKSFLAAYNQTNNKFDQLITSCKLKE